MGGGSDMGSGMGWSCAGAVAARIDAEPTWAGVSGPWPAHCISCCRRVGIGWSWAGDPMEEGAWRDGSVGVVFMVATVGPLRPEVG